MEQVCLGQHSVLTIEAEADPVPPMCAALAINAEAEEHQRLP